MKKYMAFCSQHPVQANLYVYLYVPLAACTLSGYLATDNEIPVSGSSK